MNPWVLMLLIELCEVPCHSCLSNGVTFISLLHISSLCLMYCLCIYSFCNLSICTVSHSHFKYDESSIGNILCSKIAKVVGYHFIISYLYNFPFASLPKLVNHCFVFSCLPEIVVSIHKLNYLSLLSNEMEDWGVSSYMKKSQHIKSYKLCQLY